MTSTFDNLVAFGRQEGELLKAKKVIASLIQSFPDITDSKIEQMVDCDLSLVREVRRTMK